MSIWVKLQPAMMQDQRGFISLLTCIMLSLLMIVVTLSLVTIESLQLRKSADSEQSLRAYYASEAGVEDAASQVLSGLTTDQSCSQNIAFDSTGQAGWTCQTIKFDGSPVGKLGQADEAVTIDSGLSSPNPADQFNSIILEWNTNGNAAGNYNVPGALPDVGTYTSTYAAPPLELTVVQYDSTFSTSNMCPTYNPGAGCTVTVQNALMVPKGTGVTGDVDYKHGQSGGFLGGGPWAADCGPLGRDLTGDATNWFSLTGEQFATYNCYAKIDQLAHTSNYIFRLRSRYLPSNYKMIFKKGSNGDGPQITDLPTGTATIDVTARAGQSYRRVISELPLTGGASGGLNYVMYSDTDICKNFQVLSNVPPIGGSCPSFP
jgi:hypothetical protein